MSGTWLSWVVCVSIGLKRVAITQQYRIGDLGWPHLLLENRLVTLSGNHSPFWVAKQNFGMRCIYIYVK